MIHLEAIHSSSAFNLNQHRPPLHIFMRKKKNPILSLCNKSNPSTDSDPSLPKGDARKQELLAKIAMLQAQKVRVTEFLDERAAYLTRFAEEANAEIDQVGENAMEQLDQAGARIMENIESRMQAFEESAEVNRLDIEEDERQIAEFESLIEKERNERLFFKKLKNREHGAVDRTKAKEEEEEKIGKLSGEITARARTRRNVYLLLIAVVGVGILDALISSPSYWQKPTILGIIVVGLLSQIIYEQRMTSEINREDKIGDKEKM